MSGRRRCFFCLAGTVILSFLGVVMRLNDVIGHSGDGILPNRRALHRQAAHFGRFVPVENGAELPSSAAAGLAVVPAGSTSRWFVALANFYGRSSLFEIDRSGTHRPSRLAAKLRQRLATRAAHDWEAVHLPGGRIQLVATEYDAPYSLVYELNESHTGMPPPVMKFSACGPPGSDFLASSRLCSPHASRNAPWLFSPSFPSYSAL